MKNSPVIINVCRGSLVESSHRGAIAIVNADGELCAGVGDESLVTFMRSTAKPIQALPLVASGAADRFGITTSELAVMVGSHSGEAIHTKQVSSILEKIGLNTSNLRCGVHLPSDWSAQTAIENSHESVLRNNCSGKHAGMLAQCVAGGYDETTYESPAHPVQQEIKRTFSLLAGIDSKKIRIGIEACGVPVFGLSVAQMAQVYAKLVNPAGLESKLQAACRRIVAAMLDYPELVAGTTNRICTDIMRVAGRAVIAKAGAEAVYALGVLPCDLYPTGLGITFKIEDGSERAVSTVAVEILNQLGLLSDGQREMLSIWHHKSVKDFRGETVGEIKPSFKLKFYDLRSKSPAWRAQDSQVAKQSAIK